MRLFSYWDYILIINKCQVKIKKIFKIFISAGCIFFLQYLMWKTWVYSQLKQYCIIVFCLSEVKPIQKQILVNFAPIFFYGIQRLIKYKAGKSEPWVTKAWILHCSLHFKQRRKQKKLIVRRENTSKLNQRLSLNFAADNQRSGQHRKIFFSKTFKKMLTNGCKKYIIST